MSKLPGINPGVNKYALEAEKEEKERGGQRNDGGKDEEGAQGAKQNDKAGTSPSAERPRPDCRDYGPKSEKRRGERSRKRTRHRKARAPRERPAGRRL